MQEKIIELKQSLSSLKVEDSVDQEIIHKISNLLHELYTSLDKNTNIQNANTTFENLYKYSKYYLSSYSAI